MRILITNDDGIASEAILALKKALSPLGDVLVLAPNHNWSASGHTKTMHKPLRVNKVKLPDGTDAYTSDGAPSDCVALAMLGLIGERPSLVVSGINKGANLGEDITYSGTVAAAMESVISGVPAIAVSQNSLTNNVFDFAAEFAAQVAEQVITDGLAPKTLLNVNLPSSPRSEIKGVMVTHLGRRIYQDKLISRIDPMGRDYYWIGGDEPKGYEDEGTDIWAIANSYISLTPIKMDMTDYTVLDRLRGWKLHL